MVEDEETETKRCIHTSSGAETLSVVDNLDWQEINQILVEKKCLGNIWKRDIHREINLVVARRNPESSGLKNSNIQEVPDNQE